ncbi:MAG TPA: RcnB family protein [Rhizomicrobium sp.]|jgi:Ni/Co efflux regulator RcnB|nr:RcnB family protein [Rhizomicrobium sp.]
MKRAFLTVATFGLLVLPFAGQVAAETIVKKKGPHEVVVKHRPGRPGAIVVRPNERRPHQFWHRGGWSVKIHGPAFRYPRGWRYRRWAIGAILPALFLANEYYYDDYASAGLQTPPPGYRWVRYGDDLLLVNVRTGEVEDTAYDVFE